jgi:hypothetical protein
MQRRSKYGEAGWFNERWERNEGTILLETSSCPLKGDMVATDNFFLINDKDRNVSSHFCWATCLI